MSHLDVNNKRHDWNNGDTTGQSHTQINDRISCDDDDDSPDGGWGWAIVFASFMVHVLVDGVTYSFGALATEFVSHFEASRESIGWMASILVGMTFTTGPLVSILSNKFGFRTVTMVGAFISSMGFAAPFFCSEFWFLCFSASVVTGIGFGLVYLPSIVTVSIYFQKKRAFAIGLAVCGSGIGTFIFSPLIEFFNETYGWQGSMLIVGGLILNCAACGALYRPLHMTERSISQMSSTRSFPKNNTRSNRASLNESNVNNAENQPSVQKTIKRGFMSMDNIQPGLLYRQEMRFFFSAPNMNLVHQYHHFTHQKYRFRATHPQLLISSQHSLHRHHQESIDYVATKYASPSKSMSSAHSSYPPSIYECKSCLADLFDKELLCNPIFLLFAFSNFFTSIGFNAPFLYAKDRALAMNVSNNYASFLISSIGIGNTLGRLIFGYLSTKHFINRLQLYNASLMLSGFVVIFSSFALTYPWMIVYTLSFGILTGTYVTLTSVVLVDLLGINKLNAAFGMTMVFQGAAVFMGSPLAGWIFDKTNSFDWSFWVCGGFLAVSGLMLYFVYCSKDFRQKDCIILRNEL